MCKLDECLFCEIQNGDRVIDENELDYAIYDGFPVTPLHALIIPKRHVEHYFLLEEIEVLSCHQVLEKIRIRILDSDGSVTGFNTGTNNEIDAGQTVFHCHIHLIPRRKNDCENPRSGVRGVIPEKLFRSSMKAYMRMSMARLN